MLNHGQTAAKSDFLYFALYAGPIPVELLRWKFVEGRTVELKGNAGLELPMNIGELGDSVTKIDLSDHDLRGVVCYIKIYVT